MGSEIATFDRRHRRRQETLEEVLDHAVDIMAEEGVAGLSLGEIARRMDIRPPSLYVYFPSKHALYDALFKRGWELLLDTLRRHEDAHPPIGDDLVAIMTAAGDVFTRWSVENLAYAQLLFWRPVPGFQPSENAYQPSVELWELTRNRFQLLADRGLLRPDVDVDRCHRHWSILISGVVSQQLANAPDEPFASGQYTTQVPELAAMFAAYYGADHGRRATKTSARRGHAGKR